MTTHDETHPAFGLATVTRQTGSARALFQSDIEHRDTIVLSLATASRRRDLSQDRVYPETELVEIEMSQAQWAQLISSIGLGSGVPVTIRRRIDIDSTVPEIPFTPRIAENMTEVEQSVTASLTRIAATVDALEAVLPARSSKAVRDALWNIRRAIDGAPRHARFAVSSLKEAAENVQGQVIADLETHVLRVAHQLGVDVDTLPTIAPGDLTDGVHRVLPSTSASAGPESD